MQIMSRYERRSLVIAHSKELSSAKTSPTTIVTTYLISDTVPRKENGQEGVETYL